MDLCVSVAALGRYLVITVRGELNLPAAPALASYLAAALDRQPGRDVILDVSGISFADAAGLAALLAADRTVLCRPKTRSCRWPAVLPARLVR